MSAELIVISQPTMWYKHSLVFEQVTLLLCNNKHYIHLPLKETLI